MRFHAIPLQHHPALGSQNVKSRAGILVGLLLVILALDFYGNTPRTRRRKTNAHDVKVMADWKMF
jgi:hypothetical protein